MIRLFDSHCHLDMNEFRGSVSDVLARACDAGVCRVLLAACDEASSYEVLRIARENEAGGVEVWAAAGVHPHEASGVADGLPEELTDLGFNNRVVAIGETGLDYYYDNSPRAVQAEVFERQLEWAQSVDKPVIVHLRNASDRASGDAYKEAMKILKRHGGVRGVIHCFSGEKSDAKAALELGFYISFAGPLTYPKAHELRDVASYVPLERILCETDSPYLAPQSHRGRRNEPAYVRYVYEKLAEVRGMPVEELAPVIWSNADKLFLRISSSNTSPVR